MRLNNLIAFAFLFIDPLVRASPIEDHSISRISTFEPSQVIKRDSDLFNTLKGKGVKNWQALEARRAEKCAMDVAYDQAKFSKYWTERQPSNAPELVTPQFGPRGVNNGKPIASNAFLNVEYRSQRQGAKPVDPGKTAYDNLLAPQLDGPSKGTGGVIIAAKNDASNDKFTGDDRLRFSEILFWEYKMTADSRERKASVHNLQWVFRNNIINADTMALIGEIHKRRADPGVEQQWTLENDGDAFLALIGSDNVKSIIWMLNDHVIAFARKSVASIWTQPDGKTLAIEIGYGKIQS